LSLTTLPIKVRLRDFLVSVMVDPYLVACFWAKMVLALAMLRRVSRI